MLNNETNFAEKVFLQQLEKFNKDLEEIRSDLKNKSSKSVWDEIDEAEAKKQQEKIESKRNILKNIKSKLQSLTDSVAETIVVTGEILHSSKNESAINEIKVNKLIKNLDINLEKDDFKPLAIVNYMTNTTVMPTRESHSLAETNLIISNKLQSQNISAAKFALLNNAIIPLIIEKNINKSYEFAQAYANRDNFNVDEKIIIAAIEKLKEFNKIKQDNEKLIATICRFSGTELTNKNIVNTLNSFKESIMKKSQITLDSNSILDSKFNMDNKEFSKIPPPNNDKNEVFIQYAKKYLELKLPDPNNELLNKLNEVICTQSNNLYAASELETNSNSITHNSSYNQNNHLKV